ncbi:MAG: SpoIIE family protein phosphatase [Sporichthyaceae bacterium]
MATRPHRRLRLPADDRTPAAARALVREVLAAGGQTAALDSALLLVSELATNGVVHAGTAVDVEVSADEHGVTVTVSDQQSGPVRLPPLPAPASAGSEEGEFDVDVALEGIVEDATLAEHGRGLFLVDRLATTWGTRHHPGGKSVWFRIGPSLEDGRIELGDPIAILDDAALDLAEEGPQASAWSWLVNVPEALRSRLDLSTLVAELLARLCEVTGAFNGAVWLDRNDAAGPTRLACFGPPEEAPDPRDADSARVLSVPVPATPPWHALLLLGAEPGRAPGPAWADFASVSGLRIALAMDAERLRTDDARRRGWLTYLAETSELLANSLDVNLTLALIPQIAVPRLGRWCAVHVLDDPDRGPDRVAERLRLATVAHVEEDRLSELRDLLGPDIAPELRSRLVDAVENGGTVGLPVPAEGVTVPLTARGRTLGTLTVGRHAPRAHTGEDIAVLSDVARRACLALDNAYALAERQRIAADLQRALLPAELPVAPGVEFGAEYVPTGSGIEVGGDFYDVVALRRNRWLVSIGDVCGKGTQAAAVTGLVRNVIRALAPEHRSLARTLAAVHRTLLAAETDRYATVAAAVVTRSGVEGQHVLDATLCLAGHDQPIVLRADGTTTAVGECGSAVGLLPEFEVSETRVRLAPGDSLVFFTDGVTERRLGPEQFGTRRLRHLLRGLVDHPAATVAARVRAEVVRFSPDAPRDDIAILVLRNPG